MRFYPDAVKYTSSTVDKSTKDYLRCIWDISSE